MVLPNKEHWTVDKKIPLALIVTIIAAVVLHTFSLGIWIARTEARLDNLEKSRDAIVALADARNTINDQRWSQLIRIEERQLSTGKVLEDIAKKIDRLYERGTNP